jgi:hypothetical protein
MEHLNKKTFRGSYLERHKEIRPVSFYSFIEKASMDSLLAVVEVFRLKLVFFLHVLIIVILVPIAQFRIAG